MRRQGAVLATLALLAAACGNGGGTMSGTAERTITLAVSGDTLAHAPVVGAARQGDGGYDFGRMFAPIAPIIAGADLAICHLETPVAPPGEPLSTYPLYGVPAEIADGLAAVGYDRCSTASNHTMDRGTAGIDATIAALERVGLGQSGMARAPEEATPAVFDVGGVIVAHHSYTFGLNGLVLPDDEPWRTNLIDARQMVADAREARGRGAELVVVSIHWGTEGVAAVTAEQRAVAEVVTQSGAVDLIVGHHAHVLQPIERINGVWVVFGLGNILSNLPTGAQWPASTQDGAVVTIGATIDAEGAVHVSEPVVHPTWVDRGSGFDIRLVQAGLADPSLSAATRAELAVSLARTEEVLGLYVSAAA